MFPKKLKRELSRASTKCPTCKTRQSQFLAMLFPAHEHLASYVLDGGMHQYIQLTDAGSEHVEALDLVQTHNRASRLAAGMAAELAEAFVFGESMTKISPPDDPTYRAVSRVILSQIRLLIRLGLSFDEAEERVSDAREMADGVAEEANGRLYGWLGETLSLAPRAEFARRRDIMMNIKSALMSESMCLAEVTKAAKQRESLCYLIRDGVSLMPVRVAEVRRDARLMRQLRVMKKELAEVRADLSEAWSCIEWMLEERRRGSRKE